MTRMVALLRGINVGGNRKVPMADLRALVEAGGFGDVASYIQSGNVVFTAAADVAAVTVALEKAIAERFGFAVDVIVRTAEAWRPYAGDGPFPEARRDRPNHTMLCLAARPLKPDVAEALRARATLGERVEVLGDALWIDFAESLPRSKLSPAVLDRAAGSPVTARNWNTVLKLHAMLSPG